MVDEIREVLMDYMPHNVVEDVISDIEGYGTYRENIGRDIGKTAAIDECIRIAEETCWKDADMLIGYFKELKEKNNDTQRIC